jgi:hypothetical protein
LISVGLTTVSASENLAGSKEFPGSAEQFRERIDRLGWSDLDLVLGPMVFGLTYWGLSKWVSNDFDAQSDRIWQILFPNIARALPSELRDEELRSPKWKKWRNAWCDVHTLWTHIDAGRDVLVTSNTKDFQRKAEALEAIGLRCVQTPQEAVEHLGGQHRPEPRP